MSRRRIHRAGLGLVELMAALVISASLLAATGIAIHTSFNGYQINQQQAVLQQTARIALAKMTATIRQSKLHAPDTTTLRTSFAAGQTVMGTGIDMYDPAGNLIIYRLDTANKRLLAVYNGNAYPLLEGVETFNVTMEPMRSAQSVRTGGPWDLLRRATLLVTMRTTNLTSGIGEGTGEMAITMSASIMPRRNAW